MNRHLNRHILLACTAAAMLAANAHAANVVVGGGFVHPGNSLVGGSVPANWLLGGTTNGINGIETHNETTRDTDGDDWHLRMLEGSNAGSGGYIYQVVDVVANTSYDFELDARWAGNAVDLRADVFDGDVTGDADFFNGITLIGDLFAQTLDLTSAYVQYGGTGLTPTSSTVTIRLYDLSQSTISRGIWVDDVQLNGAAPVPVPAPAALPAGLTILGLASVRRRRSVRMK